MIEALRSAANSLAAKLLLGLLVVSFAVWGVGDWLRAGQPTTVAEVDGEEIGVVEFRRAFDEQLSAFGGQVNAQTARSLGLDRLVLGQMLRRTALDLETRDLGISAPDSQVVSFIRSAPAFAAPGGGFETARYEFFLERRGMRKREFEAQIRRDIARDLVIRSVAQGAGLSRGGLERVWKRANETRDLAFVTIAPGDQPAPDAPTEAQIAAFHKAEAERFTAPEYRTVKLLWLSAAERAEPDTVSEERMRARYDERKSTYNRPERRNLEQIVFDKEDDAKAAAARLADGETFEKIAEERKLGPNDIALGYLTKADLAGLRPAVAEAAFGEETSGAVGPVKTATGWALINIRGVIAATSTSFEDAKADLAKALAEEDARAGLADAANAVEDLRAAGADFEEIAKKEDVVVRTVTFDRNGLDGEGKPVTDLPGGQALLSRTFELEVNEEMDLAELANQEYYAVEVLEVTAAALRPLDSVRDRVAAAWTEAQRRKAAETKAKDLEAALKSGETLAAAAERLSLSVTTAEGLRRDGRRPSLPAAVVRDAFDAKLGDPILGAAAASEGGGAAGAQIVATVAKITEADVKDGAEAIETSAAAGARSVEQDLAALFAEAALSEREHSTSARAVEAALTLGHGGHGGM